jgi:molybdopterin synthase catalytic subunit
MQVRVLFFGILRDLAGHHADTVDLPDHSSVHDLLTLYKQRVPALSDLAGSVAVSVNQEYATAAHVLHDNDEIAFLPPVSGGVGDTAAIAIVRETIDPQTILPRLKRSDDGAMVVFDGIVRDHTRGRRTLHLDYEAYESMALTEMRSLAEEAKKGFAVSDVAIIHRIGRLHIGETSVLIAVTAEHRAPAFDACRWLIDTLKRTVPIWKKEYFEDGAIWADGEPFPPGIAAIEVISPGMPASK